MAVTARAGMGRRAFGHRRRRRRQEGAVALAGEATPAPKLESTAHKIEAFELRGHLAFGPYALRLRARDAEGATRFCRTAVVHVAPIVIIASFELPHVSDEAAVAVALHAP